MATDDLTKKIKELTRKIKQNPGDASLHLEIAVLYSQQQEPAKARRHLDQAQEIEPGSFDVAVARLKHLLNWGPPDDLRKEFALCLKRKDKAREFAELAIDSAIEIQSGWGLSIVTELALKKFPKDYPLRIAAAWSEQMREGHDKALDILAEGGAGFYDSAEALVRLGQAAQGIGDYETAVRSFWEVTELDIEPESIKWLAQAYSRLAETVLVFSRDRYSVAVALHYAAKGLHTYREDGAIWIQMAEACAAAGRSLEASNCLKKAIKIDQEHITGIPPLFYIAASAYPTPVTEEADRRPAARRIEVRIREHGESNEYEKIYLAHIYSMVGSRRRAEDLLDDALNEGLPNALIAGIAWAAAMRSELDDQARRILEIARKARENDEWTADFEERAAKQFEQPWQGRLVSSTPPKKSKPRADSPLERCTDLRGICQDFTGQVLDEGNLGFCGREDELARSRMVLSKPGNNSFIVVGPRGSGKTALIRELALKLSRSRKDTEYRRHIVSTNAQFLIAGTRYLGEWQTQVQNLCENISRLGDTALYIRDISNLIGVGRTSVDKADVTSLLAPYAESGQVTIIGEATKEELAATLQAAPHLTRIFDQIVLEEPDVAMMREILAAYAYVTREERGVEIGTAALERAYELTSRLVPYKSMPGAVTDFLDDLVDRALQSRKKVVRESDVTSLISESTGLQEVMFSDDVELDIDATRKYFEDRVVGQPEAVQCLLDGITLIKSGLTDPRRPLGTYLFVGPTGVGKTELARTLAEWLYGSPDKVVRIDMSEYVTEESLRKLLGLTESRTVGEEGRGTLTAAVKDNPFSVVLLDEFEKAALQIHDLFLQVFDAGRLTDSAGKVTDFRSTIIIMTSNVGSEDLEEKKVGFGSHTSKTEARSAVHEAIKRTFRPEFLNRISRIVYFDALDREDIGRIANREIGRILERSGVVRRNIALEVDEAVSELLVKEGYSHEYGARNLQRAAERMIAVPLARFLISGEPAPGKLVRIYTDGDNTQVGFAEELEEKILESEPLPIFETEVEGKSKKLAVEDVFDGIGEMAERIEAVEKAVDIDSVRERVSELREISSGPTFWDNPKESADTLKELGRLQFYVDRVAKLRGKLETLNDLKYLVMDKRERGFAREAVRAYIGLSHEISVAESELLLTEPIDEKDALVIVTAPSERDESWAATVSQMYCGWARHRGFKCEIHGEVPGAKAKTISVCVMTVSGLKSFGLLRGETGTHRLVRTGRGDDSGKEILKARVKVLPFIPEELEPPVSRDLIFGRKTFAAKKGVLLKKISSTNTVEHKKSGLRVTLANAKKQDGNKDILMDVLSCVLWSEGRLRTGSEELDSARESLGVPSGRGAWGSVVRTYMTHKRHVVKDLRTQIEATNVKEVFSGSIDPFIVGYLRLGRGEK
jgi:ATP-dependent Clp protease ATP-binding subunit ClpA/protein subunit release factor A